MGKSVKENPKAVEAKAKKEAAARAAEVAKEAAEEDRYWAEVRAGGASIHTYAHVYA